jgi:hypothetical protein
MRRVITEENDSPKSYLQFAETYLVVINRRITLEVPIGVRKSQFLDDPMMSNSLLSLRLRDTLA